MDDLAGVIERFGGLLIELVVLFAVITFVLELVQRRIGEDRLGRILSSRSRTVGVLKGAALGAITPFCSCSTIPIVVGLIQAKVRFATVAAFLLASPLLNPIVLGAMVVLFGPRVTVIYGGVAFGFTVIAASLWEQFGLASEVKKVRVVRRAPVAASVAPGGVEGSTGVDAARSGVREDGDDGDDGDDGEPASWRGLRAESPQALRSSMALLRQMIVPLVIGVGIGAVIYGAAPTELLASVAGPDNPFAILVAAIAGIPLYIRAVAALPIGSALLEAGVGLGPIFALIIGGAGASIPEVSLLTGIFRPKLVVVFVVTIIGVAVAGGFAIAVLA